MEYLLRGIGEKVITKMNKGLNPYCYGIPSQSTNYLQIKTMNKMS